MTDIPDDVRAWMQDNNVPLPDPPVEVSPPESPEPESAPPIPPPPVPGMSDDEIVSLIETVGGHVNPAYVEAARAWLTERGVS